ncbi:MAG TPA: SDR family NAD(P)-dependent oxidoreductase [Usitatibacter sp.]|nr:SDR family NAD(P)-dependent oxidoreductase [Usitatibacter sp.]
MSLSGRTAVVTGAAGTHGFAAARALLEEHAQVALVDVDALRLDNMIRFLRGTTVAVPCDVSDPGAVREAHRKVEGALGPIDVLVNAASIGSVERAEATADLEWRRVLSVNLDGAFHWSREVIPGMKKRGWGRIVNVTSAAARAGGTDGGTASAASQGALAALTVTLAREVAAHGITVNGVASAYVKTPALTEEMTEAQRRQVLAQIPVGRFCEPEEFAHAVRFLASPLAGFVTGEIIEVSGGLRME